MRRKTRKLIRCVCILTAVTIVLFAAVIATSAKERPHTFRDRVALKAMGEQLVTDLVCVENIADPSEKVVEEKATVAQAAAPAEKKQEVADDGDDGDDDEDWGEDENEDDEEDADEDENEDEDDWEEDDEDWSDENWDEDDGNGGSDASGWNLLYDYEDQYSADELRYLGVIYAGDFRWTWYSQNVLPGGGLSIPGRHVDENGFICDENDRICLASSDLEWGTIVTTPFGKEGCIYDCGCASGTLDVYVDF